MTLGELFNQADLMEDFYKIYQQNSAKFNNSQFASPFASPFASQINTAFRQPTYNYFNNDPLQSFKPTASIGLGNDKFKTNVDIGNILQLLGVFGNGS